LLYNVDVSTIIKRAIQMATKTMRFPKRELNTWLRKNLIWDHDQWLELIASLKKDGFTDLVSNQEGLDEIGLYLETKKKNA
jgi:hypothetical protein